MSATGDHAGQAGSVFVEALVSAAIVAAVLGVMFATLSNVMAHSRALLSRRTALLIAQSRMATVGDEIPLSPGQVDGVEGDFVWRVRIEPGRSQSVAVSHAGVPTLVSVAVSDVHGGGVLASLRTLRLAPAS